MNRLEILQKISKYLSRFSEQVKILNSASDFSINQTAEDILITLLDKAYDLDLKNINHAAGRNFPSIDLLDAGRRVAVQVTASKDLAKIKDCIQKFYTHKLYEKADTLYIYILTERQESYAEKSLQEVIGKAPKGAQKITFDPAVHIIDKRNLYGLFAAKQDIVQLAELEAYLNKNFGLLSIEESLSPYYESLKDLFNEPVFEDESGMTLKDIYVDPDFSIYEGCLGTEAGTTPSATHAKEFRQREDQPSLNQFLKQFVQDRIDSKLKHTHPRCLLMLGYPGQGKTSMLKKFLNEYLIEENLSKKKVFYFKLKNIRNGRQLLGSPLNLLYDEACIDADVQLNRLDFNKSLLLLDGLDELYMKDNMRLDDIEGICKELSREVERHPNLQVIITSRYGYVDLNRIRRESCLIVHIELFNLKQQLEWATKFAHFHKDTWLTAQKIEVFSKSSERGGRFMTELLSQPILLQILSTLKGEMELSKGRAAIYNQLFTELLERKYSADGKLENFQQIEIDDLRALIRNIAFLIYQSGNGYITRSQLLQEPSVMQFLSKFPNADFQKNIKGVLISFYFKENETHAGADDGDVAIEFLHKSLQEYMTAEMMDCRMFDAFLDRNRKGAYIIDSGNAGLVVLDELFSEMGASVEVFGYLEGLIDARDIQEKKELSDRLALFLKEFVQYDFLIPKTLDQLFFPMDQTMRMFHAAWFYLMRCDPTRNYLSDPYVRHRVMNYISIPDEVIFSGFPYMIMTNQDFSEFDLRREFEFTEFQYASFAGASISRSLFESCEFAYNNFSLADIRNTEFFDLTFIQADFGFAEIDNCQFFVVAFVNVDFSGAEFTNVTFSECTFLDIDESKFEEMILDEESLTEFIELDLGIDLTKSFVKKDGGKTPITKSMIRSLLR